MNRKERRRLRKLRGAIARENYERNKREWASRYGPKVVMEEPTEEHVKLLLMKWVSIQHILRSVEIELKRRGQPSYGQEYLRRRLGVDDILLGKMTIPPEIGRSELMTDAWARMVRVLLDI